MRVFLRDKNNIGRQIDHRCVCMYDFLNFFIFKIIFLKTTYIYKYRVLKIDMPYFFLMNFICVAKRESYFLKAPRIRKKDNYLAK